MRKEIESLKNIINEYKGNPEKINDTPETAPSKRIKAHYDKPKSGVFVTSKVGIVGPKEKCNHLKNGLKNWRLFRRAVFENRPTQRPYNIVCL